jgi:hypothetical protein
MYGKSLSISLVQEKAAPRSLGLPEISSDAKNNCAAPDKAQRGWLTAVERERQAPLHLHAYDALRTTINPRDNSDF